MHLGYKHLKKHAQHSTSLTVLDALVVFNFMSP